MYILTVAIVTVAILTVAILSVAIVFLRTAHHLPGAGGGAGEAYLLLTTY